MIPYSQGEHKGDTAKENIREIPYAKGDIREKPYGQRENKRDTLLPRGEQGRYLTFKNVILLCK